MINQPKYPFNLPSLPYAKDALEPYISAETFSYHYDKHHKTYVDKLNDLLKNGHSDMLSLSLEEIIKMTYNDSAKTSIFNNAAQVWNHSFYWHCMKKDGGGLPEKSLMEAINRDFGSYDSFVAQFTEAALSQFGSGWSWLVYDPTNKKLEIIKTSNANTPMNQQKIAIMTIDVWEHAYYIDYKNLRAAYIETFLKHLINWEFAQDIFISL